MSVKEYTLYLPKKARLSANVSKYIYEALVYFDPLLRDDINEDIAADWLNGLFDHSKDLGNKVLEETKKRMGNTGYLFVDYYDGFFVYFDCYKAIDAIKEYTLDKHNIHILIKKIVIADIDSVQASPVEVQTHKPCSKDNYINYPSTYTFDVAI